MPVPKKRTISQPDLLKGEAPDHKMPEEQEFRQYLRSLALSAVRVLIEKVMCEELDQCVGAGWGECTPERKGALPHIWGKLFRDADCDMHFEHEKRNQLEL